LKPCVIGRVKKRRVIAVDLSERKLCWKVAIGREVSKFRQEILQKLESWTEKRLDGIWDQLSRLIGPKETDNNACFAD